MTEITHPLSDHQMRLSVILDSLSTTSRLRLTSVHVRVPRIIWPEILTHRMFSRNARSSRAVPGDRMILEVRNTPFVPWRWTGKKAGMQGTRDYEAPVMPFGSFGEDEMAAREAWLLTRDQSCDAAEAFFMADYHKQVFNRLLEPYMYIDALITSSQWANFDWLRRDDAAEPHFEDFATMMKEALTLSVPAPLNFGEWHLPYIKAEDRSEASERFPNDEYRVNSFLRKVSAARCARISYVPFNGDAQYESELVRYDNLVSTPRVHASPVEHQATPDRRLLNGEWAAPELQGNLVGFIQGRKLIPGNYVPG